MGETLYSSDGDDSDSDFVLTPVSDVDLPTITVSNNDALTVTAHRLAMLGRGRKRHRQVCDLRKCLIMFLIISCCMRTTSTSSFNARLGFYYCR